MKSFTLDHYRDRLIHEGFDVDNHCVYEHARSFFQVKTFVIPHVSGDILFIDFLSNMILANRFEIYFKFNTGSVSDGKKMAISQLKNIFGFDFDLVNTLVTAYFTLGLTKGIFVSPLKNPIDKKQQFVIKENNGFYYVNEKYRFTYKHIYYNPAFFRITKKKKPAFQFQMTCEPNKVLSVEPQSPIQQTIFGSLLLLTPKAHDFRTYNQVDELIPLLKMTSWIDVGVVTSVSFFYDTIHNYLNKELEHFFKSDSLDLKSLTASDVDDLLLIKEIMEF